MSLPLPCEGRRLRAQAAQARSDECTSDASVSWTITPGAKRSRSHLGAHGWFGHPVDVPGAAAWWPIRSERRRGQALQAVLRTPVANVDHAGAKRLCLDQLQVDPVVQGREVGRAAAQYDRTDEEPVLVDEVQPHEGGGQASAADGQVLSWLFLHLGELVGDAIPDQPGIVLDPL